MKQFKRKSTDKPWIDQAVCDMIEKRKSVFRTELRSGNWRKVKRKTEAMIKERKKKYYDKETARLSQDGAHRTAFKALKQLADADRVTPWQFQDLEPDKPVETIAEGLADYFAEVSQEFRVLQLDQLPTTYDRPPMIVTAPQVCEALRKMKKPRSAVNIDPLPQHVNQYADRWANILATTYNEILAGKGWPQVWKAEEVSVIPKTNRHENASECRNISCTSIFSKLCEEFMLEGLRGEVSVDEEQFGGVRGSGTTHLLAEMITDVMECLDDNRAAVSLISVDLAKAFNRMNIRHAWRPWREEEHQTSP